MLKRPLTEEHWRREVNQEATQKINEERIAAEAETIAKSNETKTQTEEPVNRIKEAFIDGQLKNPSERKPLPIPTQENIILLAIFSDKNFQLIRDTIDDMQVFTSPVYQKLAGRVFDYIDQYHRPPKEHVVDLFAEELDRVMQTSSRDEPDLQTLNPNDKPQVEAFRLYQTLKDAKTAFEDMDEEFVVDNFQNLILKHKMASTMLSAVAHLNDNNLAGALEALEGLAQTTPAPSSRSRHHFNLITLKDLVETEIPEPEWLAEGLLPAGGLSLITAKPYVGKTTFCFWEAVCVARGSDFLGRQTRQGPVVFLALEDSRINLQNMAKKAGALEEPIRFHIGAAPQKAFKEVEALIAETGAVLLIIDILQKFLRIENLNDYSQVITALEQLMDKARKLNCHVQLTHHSNKIGQILGSIGLEGGVDTSILLKKSDDDDRRTFQAPKVRNSESIPKTILTLYEDGSVWMGNTQREAEEEDIGLLVDAALDKYHEMILRPSKNHKYPSLYETIQKSGSGISEALRRRMEAGMTCPPSKLITRVGTGKSNDPFVYMTLKFLREKIQAVRQQKGLIADLSKWKSLKDI